MNLDKKLLNLSDKLDSLSLSIDSLLYMLFENKIDLDKVDLNTSDNLKLKSIISYDK